MEATELTPNLTNILNEFIDTFLDNYRYLLERSGKSKTGTLVNSLKNLGVTTNGSTIEGNISIAEHWKYVENGRRPGKFPPQNKIFDWARSKSLPRPNASITERNQFAFLVARKISELGIKSGGQFSEALDLTWQKLGPKISEALGDDIGDLLENVTLRIVS